MRGSLRGLMWKANGLLAHIANGRIDYIRYLLWTRWKGLDFTPVPLETLGFSEHHSVSHAASGGVFLRDILNRIDMPAGSRVIDIGCGKGSAMCTLGTYPFKEVAGVELSESLARIAETNARKLGLDHIKVYVSDATEFSDFDRFTHIYMFNPFPDAVMRRVIDHIRLSLQRVPRRLTIIYVFPACHDVIMQSGLFRVEMECAVNWYTRKCSIYVHGCPATETGMA